MNDRQRLEAIVAVVCKYLPPDGISRKEAMSQIISLVDPLPEQAEKQEPVAYIDHVSGKPKFINGYVVQTDYDIPLYTAPPRKEWVGLTDEEVWVAYEKGMYEEMWFARAVEAMIKERNT